MAGRVQTDAEVDSINAPFSEYLSTGERQEELDMTIDTFYVEPAVSATWSVTPTIIIPPVIIGLYQFSDESCQSGGMLA
eukprot:10544597-Heterocapsa_arctica.AAC.1